MSKSQADLEDPMVAGLERGDHSLVATLLLDAYGDEIYGFLVARLRDRVTADDAFSSFAEQLWRGLPTLRLRTTIRAWAYSVAHSAACRTLDGDVRRARRQIEIPSGPGLEALVHRVRTRTPQHLQTEMKDAIARLRERLTDDERTLLMLRVDRGLEWREVAEALDSVDEDPSRESARLRKRFEALTKKLRRLAQAEGLLEG